jgi:hypothetical protein
MHLVGVLETIAMRIASNMELQTYKHFSRQCGNCLRTFVQLVVDGGKKEVWLVQAQLEQVNPE